MTAALTGPSHPLLRRIRDADRALRAYLPVARAIIEHHRLNGISGQSVYRLDGRDRWTHLGSYEDERWRLASSPDVLAVSGRDDIRQLAYTIAQVEHPDRLPGSQARAVALRDAAQEAAPMVAVVLAVAVHGGLVEWDTTETVQGAGWRLSLDAAWRLLPQPNPTLPRPRDVFAEVLGGLGYTGQPAEDYARHYLDDRDAINASLEAAGVRFGGRMLTAVEAAGRAKVAGGTWTAYVSRGQAPATDEAGQWRTATVDAWRMSRTRRPVDW